MSTINKIKNKQKTQSHHQSTLQSDPSATPNSSNPYKRSKIFPAKSIQESPERECHYATFNDLKEQNPQGVEMNMEAFPNTKELANEISIPCVFSVSPMLSEENSNTNIMNKNIEDIPRCGICRAYMNCHNTILENGKKFRCFLCGELNYSGEYSSIQEPNNELHSSIYQAEGNPNTYMTIPSEDIYVIILDISEESGEIVRYASAAIKEVLSRNECEELKVCLYTIDELVTEYDFSGEEAKCITIDASIKHEIENRDRYQIVGQIREKLFSTLDLLPHLTENKTKKSSNFYQNFEYIYNISKGTGCKFFVLQTHEGLLQESYATEDVKIVPNINGTENVIQYQGPYDTRNRLFFDRFTNEFINNSNSVSFFFFGKTYKNIKTLGDFCKVTNSELKYYSKSTESELQKFYYEFIYLLSSKYFKELQIEFIITKNWAPISIYSNSYRLPQSLVFKCSYIDPSKKFFISMIPTAPTEFCAFQIVVSYRYEMKEVVTVATVVQVVTSDKNKVYEGIHVGLTTALLYRIFLSNLRLAPEQTSRQKLLEISAQIYRSTLSHFESSQKFPYSILSILQSTLSMLKTLLSFPTLIERSPALDRCVSERNYLFFCCFEDTFAYSLPWLFEIGGREDIERQWGEDSDGGFVYPTTITPQFETTREGIFLMDNGLSLYLFIGKNYEETYLNSLFTIPIIHKKTKLIEENLSTETPESEQLLSLIEYIRSQKYYGWVPLYIVYCGEATLIEKEFYLKFYAERYDEFKYKLSFEDYLDTLEKFHHVRTAEIR